MSKNNCTLGLLTLSLLLTTGCAVTRVTGSDSKWRQVAYGNIGIIGEDHEVTLLAGSEVSKLSIMGEDIHVCVEEGAVVDKIEIVGEGNVVECPDGMPIEYSEIGEDNRIRHHSKKKK